MLMQAVRGELTVGTIRYSIFEGRPHISMIEVLEDYRRQGIATQMLRYLQGQYPNEEIVWGYLTEDGSALYQAVVDEQPNPDYLRVQNDLEDITREFDAYVRRLDGGAILSPQEAADMDDLEDTQYRLEKELEDYRPEPKRKELNFTWPEAPHMEKVALAAADLPSTSRTASRCGRR